MSRTAINARVTEIERQLHVLGKVPSLTKDQDIDRRSLMAQLRSARFDLTEQRSPFTDPLSYAGFGSGLDVSAYIKRAYAPLPVRLASMRGQLAGCAGYLESARDNLEPSLPRPHLETAIDAGQGQISYLRGEVSEFAAGDRDTLAAISEAVRHLAALVVFLEDRLSQAHDDYALGSDRFLRPLHMREMVDIDLASFQRMGRADLDRNLARIHELAQRIAPEGGVPAALDQIERDHSTAATIIGEVAGTLEELRGFIIEKDLMSVPSEVRCLVRQTPAYYAYVSAALDGAGPLETVATESYYYVTVPGSDWGEARADEWLRYLNRATLRNVSIHEAYPGHYLQALHERLASSLSRRLLWVQSTGEGWAHYVEEMMVEVGYRRDPAMSSPS